MLIRYRYSKTSRMRFPALVRFTFLLPLLSCAVCEDGESQPPLVIDPFRLTVEVGTDSTLTCAPPKETNLRAQVVWFYPDNVTQVPQETNTSRIFVDEQSRLHFRHAEENDTGVYLCSGVILENSADGTIPSGDYSSASTTKAAVVTTAVDAAMTAATSRSSTEENATTSYQTGTSGIVPRFQEVSGPTSGDVGNSVVYNATVEVKVYVMPSYFTEGMIILGINLGLLLLFLICLAQSYVTERKRLLVYRGK